MDDNCKAWAILIRYDKDDVPVKADIKLIKDFESANEYIADVFTHIFNSINSIENNTVCLHSSKFSGNDGYSEIKFIVTDVDGVEHVITERWEILTTSTADINAVSEYLPEELTKLGVFG